MSSTDKYTHPTLDQLLIEIGEVGDWLSEMKACEGGAGNISVCMNWDVDASDHFPNSQRIELPLSVPDMVGKSFLVTGAGTRLRDLRKEPYSNIGFLHVESKGKTGLLYTNSQRNFRRLTSEFNTHLSLHQREIIDKRAEFNAVVHAQPIHLTYLTSIPEYQDSLRFSRAISRWQPEMLLTFPKGVIFLPFKIPNSDELMEATRNIDSTYNLIVWAKHGVLAISNQSVNKALDLIEYAETGARYEYLNLINQNRAEGLNPEDIKGICEYFHINNSIFNSEEN